MADEEGPTEEKKVTEVKSLKKGSFVIMDDEPCVVDDVAISKPGKHGAAKARAVATGIFDGKKRTYVGPADERIGVPIIEKRNAQVISIAPDRVQLMDTQDYSIFEALKPEFEVKEGDEVLIWRFGNKVLIKNKK